MIDEVKDKCQILKTRIHKMKRVFSFAITTNVGNLLPILSIVPNLPTRNHQMKFHTLHIYVSIISKKFYLNFKQRKPHKYPRKS